MPHRVSRRRFLGTVAAGAAAAVTRPATARAAAGGPDGVGEPALLGGRPVRTEAFPSWPIADAREEQALLGVLRSGKWGRGVGEQVKQFERAYAELTGARHCLATANGSTALLTSLYALDVGAGDEVIVPPYTFVATVNAVLLRGALPIFVDTDIETFQIDARRIESAITERTRVIVPVHLGGSAADLDTILAVAQRRRLPVLEDACQAHLGEWKGRKVGTLGQAGCFSFQASKNLNCGEGGAIVTDDPAFVETCYTFHNNSRTRATSGDNFSYRGTGGNFRLTEFQAGILQAQMTRLDAQSRTREANASYLSGLLKEIPGLTPARMYAGCTRNAYHLYMFRYDPAQFASLPRARFLEALKAEGIPAAAGYAPLNKEAFLEDTLTSRGFRRIYGERAFAEWRERSQCPQNDRLCGEAVWLGQTMLLGTRADMDQIAEAARKVSAHAARLAKAG
ncbi:MAG TPA: DegT/DnrJ/EryC1/StrS family aminotransferase [Vicinamibacteria bacterium]|nr:DegT/DnrJ/EryC1/StrS family aminotransferase [Vicinamibacteria bacterium]